MGNRKVLQQQLKVSLVIFVPLDHAMAYHTTELKKTKTGDICANCVLLSDRTLHTFSSGPLLLGPTPSDEDSLVVQELLPVCPSEEINRELLFSHQIAVRVETVHQWSIASILI